MIYLKNLRSRMDRGRKRIGIQAHRSLMLDLDDLIKISQLFQIDVMRNIKHGIFLILQKKIFNEAKVFFV